MKKMAMMVPLLLLLFSCGRGGGGLPPERPFGELRGHAVDALIVNGSLTAYDYDLGQKGRLLGTTTTNELGAYNLALQASSGPVLLEITGGYYTEEASGKRVVLNEGQVLRAVSFYESGQSLTIMVTPFTNLAAGLVAYKIAEGINVGVAITEATSAITAFVGLDVLGTFPRNITDPANAVTEMTDEHRYGFFTAGLSALTAWASEQNSVAVHTIYTAIAFAQLMYDDIQSDGLLDGITLVNGAGSNLSFGTVALGANVYRSDLARYIIAIANDPVNKTGLGVPEVLDLAMDLSRSTHAVFAGVDPQPVDVTGPTIAALEAEDGFKGGVFSFAVAVDDFVGVASVVFDLDGEELGNAVKPTDPTILIDSRSSADGDHQIGVRAIDNIGNESYLQYAVKFDNSDPFVEITSSLIVNDPSYTLTGTYNDPGVGLDEIFVNALSATKNTDGTWFQLLTLEPGENTLAVKLVDQVGNVIETETEILLDITAPVSTFTYPKVTFVVNDSSFPASLGDFDINKNEKLLLGFETLSILGTILNQAALNARRVPYLALTVKDPPAFEVFTALDDLRVEYRYSIDGDVIADYKAATKSVDYLNNREYLVPFANETLSPDWFQTPEAGVHTVSVRVTDQAGNRTIDSFSFRAKFDLQDVTIVSLQKNATANLYAFVDGVKGGLIGSCMTDNVGQCRYGLYAEAKPLLVEVMGGNYVEAATGGSVLLDDTEGFSTIVLFEAKDIIAIVTPLTHVASAYFKHQIQALSFEEAYASVKVALRATYGFDVFTTLPVDVTSSEAINSGLTEGHKYGFQLAALSEYAAWANVENGLPEHAQYTTVTLAGAMYQDIIFDGNLNGKGSDGPLSLGTLVLDDYQYRFGIGNQLLEFTKSEANASGFAIADVFGWANLVASSQQSIYAGKAGYDLDATGPMISLAIADNWQRGTVTLVPGVSDGNGDVVSVEFRLDNMTLGRSMDPLDPMLALDTSLSDDGGHKLEITAVDEVGNTSLRQFVLKFDNTSPVVSITSSDKTGSETFKVTGTVEETGSGIQRITVAGVTAIINVDGSWFANVTLDNEGENKLEIVAKDNVGNNTNKKISILLDTQLPSYTITSSKQTRDPNFVVTGTVSEGNDGAGIRSIVIAGVIAIQNTEGSWSASVTLDQEGNNKLKLLVTDEVGNQAESDVNILLDQTSPRVKVTSNSLTDQKAFVVTGTFSDVGSGVQGITVGGIVANLNTDGSWSANVSLNNEGNNNLGLLVIDKVGNKSESEVVILLDQTLPRVKVTSSSLTDRKAFVVTGTFSDVGSGVQGITVGGIVANLNTDGSWSANVSLTNEGNNNLGLLVIDKVGNKSESEVVILLDQTSPRLTITSETITGSKNFVMAGTTRDVGAGIDRITIGNVPAVINNDQTWSANIVLLREGDNNLKVRVTDRVGNSDIIESTVFLDQTGPSIIVTSPAITGSAVFDLTGTVIDEGAGIQRITVAGGSAVINADNSWSARVKLEQEGKNRLAIIAIDRVGNEKNATTTVALDTTDPTIRLISGSISMTGAYTMMGSVTDNGAGIRRLTVGGQVVDVDESGSWQFNTSLPSEGDNIFAAELVDNVGNVFTQNLIILRDTIAPVFTMTSSNAVSTTTTVVSGTYQEDGAGLDTFSVNGLAPTLNMSAKTWSISLALTEGNNTFAVEITDKAGFRVLSDIRVIRDTKMPVVAVNSKKYVGSAAYTLTGTYGDAVSGVESISVDNDPVELDTIRRTWRYEVNLSGGDNIFNVAAIDNVGNRRIINVNVTFDAASPTRTDFYSFSKFSNGVGGYYEASLRSVNPTGNPLYISTDNISSGTLTTVTDFDAADIPYIGMNVRDVVLGSRNTADGDIVVKIQYTLNDEVKQAWKILAPSPVSQDGSGYVVPISTEGLHESWTSSTNTDIHRIEFELIDLLGNSQNYVHEFRVEFVTPALSIQVEDVNSFTETFADRRAMFNKDMIVNTYAFTNPGDEHLYIKMSDPSLHTASNVLERVIRENDVRLVGTSQWRVKLAYGFIEKFAGGQSEAVIYTCRAGVISDWMTVGSLSKWQGAQWQAIFPAVVPGDIEQGVSDVPGSPEPTSWSDKALPDNKPEKTAVSNRRLYRDLKFYDGAEDRYAYINCKPYAYLNWQERRVYAYVSESGYPRNTLTTIIEEVGFSTSRFEVRDDNNNIISTVADGWYKIFPGSTVTVSKYITAPDLPSYDDVEVADLDNFSSYTEKKYDKTLTWNIARAIEISRAAGDNRGPKGIVLGSLVGSGIATYTVGR